MAYLKRIYEFSSEPVFSSASQEEVKRGKPNILSRFAVHKKKTKLYRLEFLDGSEGEFKIDENAKGHELFDKICELAHLREKYYFGLSLRSRDGTKIWLDLNKKIRKQIEKNEAWIFSFEVKFYPTNPEELEDELTRYYMCLQIRNDILCGKLRCSPFLLASYLAQSHFGDYDPDSHKGDYLSVFPLVPNQTRVEEIKIMELHKQHKGLTPDEAEWNFLKVAKKLKMYGVSMHEVKDWRNFSTMIGVCPSGLQVYKPVRSKMCFQRYEWSTVLEVTSKRNKFAFELRKEGEALPPRMLEFTLPNDESAKRLWKTCIEYYTFYRLKRPKSIPRTRRFLFRRKIHKKYIGPTEYKLNEMYAATE